MAGIHSALLFSQQLRRRDREKLELESKLTKARLETLKLQLQPHFLFNALNAVSTLLHRDAKRADRMIGELSTLLRGVLEDQHADLISLTREAKLVEAYASIEQLRFGDRVNFDFQFDTDCQSALVPPMLLQPLVENAVRHGIEPLGTPGTVWLIVEKKDARLSIRIEDDGIGRNNSETKGWGIGLSNAEARLDALFDKAYELTLDDRQGGGTVVTIELPFREAT